MHGGSRVIGQNWELKQGPEIVVCTPSRMTDILATSGSKTTNLRRVTFLVLDKADRMLDMGFKPQINRIIGNIRPDCQTVMFTATFQRSVRRSCLLKYSLCLHGKVIREPQCPPPHHGRRSVVSTTSTNV